MAEENLFRRLTKLFRSGPTIKRKIKSYDAKAKGASSSVEMFKKQHSDVYNSTMSAYGAFDRMARYSDFAEMEACVAGWTKIASPSGFVEIQELAKRCEANADYSFIVYAYDHEKQQIVPTFGKCARKTSTQMAYKVTFDSGKELIATADHRVMRRDGTYCEVQDLQVNDSMMPFYRRDFFAKPGEKEDSTGYQWVYTMDKKNSTMNNGWIAEHRLIAAWVADRKVLSTEHVHHKNFKKFDNSPENLQIMDAKEHLAYHAEILNGKKWDHSINSEWIKNFKINHSKFMTENNPAERSDVTFPKILQLCDRDGYNWAKLQMTLDCSSTVISNRLRDNGFKNFTSFATAYDSKWRNNGWNNKGDKNPRYDKGLSYQAVCNAYSPGIKSSTWAAALGTTYVKILGRLKQNGFANVQDFRDNFENHKVVSVEPYEVIDLYDLTVDGYKNYATDSIIIHNTPEIASALDIYAEETVSEDAEGKCLHIRSDNRKIRELLSTLFYDTLNVDFNMVMWVRNLVKYGDFFLFNDIHPEFGVINAYPIPITEMEREEGYDPDDPSAVRFRWVANGNQVLENWQISHFRLLGNDAFLPYGSSVLESARRIWRQLILIEDAMLVYRVMRSPERRVFYIDVGNVPPEDVPNYVEQAKTALKRAPVVNKSTGQVDLRYNPMPIWKDTPIPLLDGRTLTIEELSKEVDAGKECWVYSIQDETNQIVPGKVSWCGKNYTADMMIKVWLDDDTYVMTAPEHPFVMRDGSSKRADELEADDSLMPLYRKMSSKEENWDIQGYPIVYDPGTNKDILIHRRVANSALCEQRETARKDINWGINNNLVVHHKNFNSLDATPSNLVWMGNVDHWKYHALVGRENLIAYNKSAEKRKNQSKWNIERNSVAAMAGYNGSDLHKSHNENRRVGQAASWKVDKKVRKESMRWNIPKEVFEFVADQISQNPKINRNDLTDAIRSDNKITELLEEANKNNNRSVSKFNIAAMVSVAKREGLAKGYGDFRSAVDQGYRNHKVIRTEEVFDSSDVYCMTVIGPKGEDDRHNFAVQSIELDGKYSKNGVFVKNSVDEDYFIPVRGGESGTKIDNLAGGQNTSAIEDVEYIQKKLFAALKIPKAYLGYDEDVGAKATLAQEDIRFSRTIQRIQKTIIAELNKIAMIHLFSHGFDGEDLLDFSLQLSNPSSLAQQQKLALIEQKFSIASAVPEGMVSRGWIRRNVFGFTRDEIERIEDEKVEDKRADLELEATTAPEAGGDAGGDDGGDDGGDGGVDLFASDYNQGDLLTAEPSKYRSKMKEADDEYNSDEEYSDDDIDIENISMDGVKPSSNVKQKNIWGEPLVKKRDRKVKGGPLETGMPDFKTMVSTGKAGRAQDTLNDPYDKDFLKNPFGKPFSESKKESLADMILGKSTVDDDNYIGYRPSLDHGMLRALESMRSGLGIKQVLKENIDEELDFELEEDDE